jgi:hypothetical protein
MRQVVNVYNPDIRWAYIAQQKLTQDGFVANHQIVEVYTDGEHTGYAVSAEKPGPDDGRAAVLVPVTMEDGLPHQGSRRALTLDRSSVGDSTRSRSAGRRHADRLRVAGGLSDRSSLDVPLKHYRATLTDADGETHEYHFSATYMWKVTDHIAREMGARGDFYGHKREDTITLEVAELIERPEEGIPVIEVR